VFLDEKIWTGNIFIGGGWRPGRAEGFDVIEPATGNVLGRSGLADAGDVAEAAERAAEAQRSWAAAPHPRRAAVLRRAAQLWTEHAEEISWWNVREVGAIPPMAGFALHVAEQECYEAAALPSRPFGELLPSEEPRLSMSRRVPAGVVAVIAPFNVPIILAIRSVAPALALGNAVILKPDPRTAVTGGVTLARIFEEAGLPEGLFQVLPGGADVGEALITHPLVRVISFTGSTRAGRRVGALAGEHLKRAHLELGGNSAMIVLDDADVDQAVSAASFGSFFHQGQICMTTGRHLVHERLYDDFVERLAAKAAALPVGDPARVPVVLGPIIDAGQRDKIHGLVTGSAAAGARVAAGGTYQDLFYSATVLADVTDSTPAFTEEIFGPVAPVMRFSDVESAVRLATASDYGLSLGIVTRDVMKGLALADRIPTGIVHINDQTVSDEANSPFGGVAASGTGSRFGGAGANVDAFTETRWVTVRDQPPSYPF
jgi:benzaldehyde dehydrogenase (NAD)